MTRRRLAPALGALPSLGLLVALVTVLGGLPTLAGAAQEATEPPVVTVLDLPVNDLAYDRFSDTIYASVPSRAGALGNRVAAIDPATGDVGPSVFVGSEPSALAMSDDGEFLYVALQGAAAVRRVHVPSFTAGLQFSLGSDQFTGPYFAEDMEVVPGDSGTVAVSRRNVGFSPRHEGVAIYDDGVKRPNETPGHTGSNRIAFGSSPKALGQPETRLYGYNNETTEFGFRRMEVDPAGVATLTTTQNLVTGFGVDIEFDDGRVYATSGRVVDAEASTLAGTYSGVNGPVEPDSSHGRVSFVSGGEIQVFDLDEFTPLPSIPLPGLAGTPASLIDVGDGDLAFRTTADQVFLVRFPPLLGSSPSGVPATSPAGASVDTDGRGVRFTR